MRDTEGVFRIISHWWQERTLISLGVLLESMYDIVKTRKMENGVACYYDKNGKREFDSFNYQELIDMKINALDLLKDPKNYAVDPVGHRVVMKK